MDRFRALEVFVAVAEESSFAGASRALTISPPSVTRIIGDLEDSIGTVLFHRTTRLVTLTDAGRGYFDDAKKLLSDFEAANDSARGAHRAPTGILSVTASTLFGQHYISPIILEYLDLYPDIRVEALFLERIVNLMEEGVDIAIRLGHLPDSSLIATKVGEVGWQICGCPSYFEKHGAPQKPEDLADHNIIAVGPLPSYGEWRFANGVMARVKPRLIYSSVAACIKATESGWGLTRALSYQIGPQLESGKMQSVLSDHALERVPIHIVHGEGRRMSAKVRTFVDLAVERLRNDPFLN